MYGLPGGGCGGVRRGHRRLPLRFRLLRLLHHLRHRQGGGAGLRPAETKAVRAGRPKAGRGGIRRGIYPQRRGVSGGRPGADAVRFGLRRPVRQPDRAGGHREPFLPGIAAALHGGHGGGGGGHPHRRGAGAGLQGGGGLRPAHQPGAGPHPGRGRHRAGHRHGADGKRHLRPPWQAGGAQLFAVPPAHPAGHGPFAGGI